MSIAVTDDRGIREINRKFLGRDEPTDVLSFRFEPFPGEDSPQFGEIIINAQRAEETKFSRKNWDVARELALYLAHGCDHLSNETDYDPRGRQRMRRRELAWLRSAHRLDLLRDLIG